MSDSILIHTINGRRIEVRCPVCAAANWGELLPRDYDPNVPIRAVLVALVGDENIGLEVLRHVCLNCGFVMHRSGVAPPAT